MPTVYGAPEQVFCGTQYSRDKIAPVVSADYNLGKPEQGGLWTSPVTDSGLSEWQVWCNKNREKAWARNPQKLTVCPFSKILKIETIEDFDILASYDFCWEKIALDYDAVWMTYDAVSYSRWRMSWGWDIESILWFRHSFV